jgi:hypothetical protein
LTGGNARTNAILSPLLAPTIRTTPTVKKALLRRMTAKKEGRRLWKSPISSFFVRNGELCDSVCFATRGVCLARIHSRNHFFQFSPKASASVAVTGIRGEYSITSFGALPPMTLSARITIER